MGAAEVVNDGVGVGGGNDSLMIFKMVDQMMAASAVEFGKDIIQ